MKIEEIYMHVIYCSEREHLQKRFKVAKERLAEMHRNSSYKNGCDVVCGQVKNCFVNYVLH